MKRNDKLLALFLFSLLSASTILASDVPPIPFQDEGACRFECCTYRDWTVTSNTIFYENKDTKSKVIFGASKGEKITGITGVVITLRPGRAFVRKKITISTDENEVTANPGDILYILHYEGEGYSRFWLHGKIYSYEIPSANQANEFIRTASNPETVWWVQAKNSKGQIGWSKETDHFDHMDSCE